MRIDAAAVNRRRTATAGVRVAPPPSWAKGDRPRLIMRGSMTAGARGVDVAASGEPAARVGAPHARPALNALDMHEPYTVHLPGFDGPLELLLHLIERNQLEITAISLVAVTDQFISYLRTWDEPPLPRLAEFVAMAARLLLIKSRSLLPRQGRQEEGGDEPDPLEDAENLRRHLEEYKIARDIAQALRAR